MKKSFIKMHGLGNDFAIFDGRTDGLALSPEQIRKIADRRRGVGCDQVILLQPPQTSGTAAFMRIYNIDGTEAEACGNATRCVARLLMDENKLNSIIIQTVAGLLSVNQKDADNITVDMGQIKTLWNEIPLAHPVDTLDVPVTEGVLSNPVAINIGNPHAVFFVENVDAIELSRVGPLVEKNAMFPAKVNVEIAQILSRNHIRMRVWERGSGITEACGSAACATVAAAVRRGLADRTATVTLDGGDLHFVWREADDHILMTGPVAEVFRAEMDI